MAALAEALLADVTAAAPPAPAGDSLSQWRARAAAALRGARGAGVVIAGASQPASVHAAVHRLNAALGNAGATVFYTMPATAPAEPLESLVAAMQAGEVAALVMLDTNPAYTAPGDLGFLAALARVQLKVHAGLYTDETANHADWHLPLAHPLESWGDARAFDGTISMIQPTVAPLYDARSAPEMLAMIDRARVARRLRHRAEFWRRGRRAASRGLAASLRDGSSPAARSRARRCARRPRRPRPAAGGRAGSSCCSAPIRRYGTAATRTTRGCRNCRSR